MKKTLFIFLVLLFLCRDVWCAVPVTFTNNTVADATEVNENNNYFENKFSLTSGHNHSGLSSKATLKGEWQGTVVDEAYGGTGQNIYSSGDMLFATADTTLVKLARPTNLGAILLFGSDRSEPQWLEPGTRGQVLESKDTNVNPEWKGRFAIGSFTHDIEIEGTKVITGIGFKTKFLLCFSTIPSGENQVCWGGSTTPFATANTWALFNYEVPPKYDETPQIVYIQPSAGVFGRAVIASVDSDSFTLTWDKTGSPTGIITTSYYAFNY